MNSFMNKVIVVLRGEGKVAITLTNEVMKFPVYANIGVPRSSVFVMMGGQHQHK